MSLIEKLEKLRESDTLPMHMPGHKRWDFGRELPYSLDITEIDGFDDLHHRSGILGELSERAAKLRKARCAFPLVNGSTVGILAAVYALTRPGDTVIVARNCHKSVYHACEVGRLNTEYIYPDMSEDGFFLSVKPESVKTALENHPGAKLVIITSPTYEGVISDIGKIADIVHSFGVKLLVDAAHGAHLGYSPLFPQDALSLGGDVSVESLHKTLPALTQTAVLYANAGVDAEKIEYALDIFETSSPSYILMASMEKCLDVLEADGTGLFEKYYENLDAFYRSVKTTENIKVIDYPDNSRVYDLDKGKIIVSTHSADINGFTLAEILRRKYHIEPEMATPGYVICMTSICDEVKSFERLARALTEIDSAVVASAGADIPSYPFAERSMMLSKAQEGEKAKVPLSRAEGEVSAEYLWAYPPGIPVIAPGEMISKEIIAYIDYCRESGCNLIIPGRMSADEIYILIK